MTTPTQAATVASEVLRIRNRTGLGIRESMDAYKKFGSADAALAVLCKPEDVAEFASAHDMLRADLARLRAANAALTEALKDALHEYDDNTCTHESTHRGGTIWTICDGCDAKWADDEGGFVPYTDPPRIVAARAALASVEPQS